MEKIKRKIIWLAASCVIAASLVLASCAQPQTAEQHNERGVALFEEGQYEQSITEFNKAIELDPEYAMAYNNRGNACWNKGDLDRAIADYGKTIELDPEYAEAYGNRGFVYYLKGELTKAISDLEKCLELSNDPQLVKWAQHWLDQLR